MKHSSILGLAALAVLAACGDAPTAGTTASESPVTAAAFDVSTPSLLRWTGGGAPTGFVVRGNTLACASAGVKLDIGSGTPRNGTLAGGAISYSITGTTVSFTSTLPITYAAIKGGQATNVYTFSPATYTASGLVTPDNLVGSGRNQRNNGPAGLSHFSLCVGDPSPTISLDASGTFTREFGWSIEKTAGTATLDADGMSASQPFTVAITKTVAEERDHAASGTVTVSNPTPFALTIAGIAVSGSGLGPVAATCPSMNVAANSAVTCSWSASTQAASYTVDVDVVHSTVTIAGLDGQVTWQDPADVTGSIGYAPSLLVHDAATLSDDQYAVDAGPHTADYSETYSVTYSWTCGTGSYESTNTARIVNGDGLDKSDAATVSYTKPDCPPTPPSGGTGSGTAFAFGDIQFSTLSGNGSRWGWVLTLGAGQTTTVNVYGGAGQYKTDNLVGTAVITHTGNAVTVTATPTDGCALTGQSVFYSPDMPTMQDVNSPGRYAAKSDALGGQTAYVTVHWNYSCSN